MIQDCQKKGGAKFLQTLPIDTNWVMAYTECFKQADPQADEVKALRVALSSKVPVHLKPGEVYTLKAICHTKPGSDKFQAVVCSSEDTPTPGGLIIYDQIVDVQPMSHCKFKVAVKNASRRGITLYPGTAFAECSPIDWAVPVALSDLNPQPKDAPLQAHSLLASHSEDGSQSAVPLGLDFGDSPISPQYKEHIQARIAKEASNAFSKHDLDVGIVTGVTHRIELEPHVPFKERTRRVSPADFNDLKRHLQDLLAAGIIEESHSPYASPVVLVRKKNGELRMVVDYRRLNNLTKKDAYPLPRIEETFTLLSGSKWFTVLDLKSGYYQLEVEPCDRPKTAFTTPFGTWQFRRMPQGLTNSPATFQQTMEKVMEGINLQEVVAFLDDLIIFSNSLEEHEERVMKVLKHIAEFGLKLSPSKCKFFQTSVKYLGHVISAQGIQPDPDKIVAVKDWPCPQTAKELRSFLGFTGYYRRFVRDYSCIVRPLNDLLKGELAPRHKGQKHWP
uniref:ribonuclease H n=1 Tax=Oreochromis niloticus TaxID=8128 RepID=A0A669CY19_ORENI